MQQKLEEEEDDERQTAMEQLKKDVCSRFLTLHSRCAMLHCFIGTSKSPSTFLKCCSN